MILFCTHSLCVSFVALWNVSGYLMENIYRKYVKQIYTDILPKIVLAFQIIFSTLQDIPQGPPAKPTKKSRLQKVLR